MKLKHTHAVQLDITFLMCSHSLACFVAPINRVICPVKYTLTIWKTERCFLCGDKCPTRASLEKKNVTTEEDTEDNGTKTKQNVS